MYPFHLLFPEIGTNETRVLTVARAGDVWDLPPGEYAYVELYCVKANCDCRRVVFSVMGWDQGILATISHAFEPRRPRPGRIVLPQTMLEPILPQSRWSEIFLELFQAKLLTEEYTARLERHYRMVKDALADPNHAIHGRFRAEPGAFGTGRKKLDLPPIRRNKRYR